MEGRDLDVIGESEGEVPALALELGKR